MSRFKLNYLEQLLQPLNDSERVEFKFFYRQHSKRLGIAYLWLIFLGIFGLHKFYLNSRLGWFYLLFCWTLIPVLLVVVDVFLLPWQVRKYNRELAVSLCELIAQLNQQTANLLLIEDKLRRKRVHFSEWVMAIILIAGVILPLVSYANLRLTAHRLEIHYKTNHLDGTQSDSFLVL